MKVMTYNIRLGIQQGVEAIAGVISAQNPDIVALQEVGQHWHMGPRGDTCAEIAELTGFAHHYYVPTIAETPGHRYGHALLSRWPIEQAEIFEFSREIDEPRAALVARILSPQGPLQVIATHLSHKEVERARQAPELLGLVEKNRATSPVTIVLGDLNALDRVDWLRRLSRRMTSAARLTDAPTFPNPAPDRRIDHILVSGATVLSAEVVEEASASDHRPLVAEIKIDAPAGSDSV